MLRLTLSAAALLVLANCDTAMMGSDTTTAGMGKNYQQMQAEYPDLSVIEFEVLDDNNDGVISADEEMDIGGDEDELTVDDEG